MKNVSVKFKNLILALCIIMLAVTGAATTLYGDDFIYALYFRRGAAEFFRMTCDHYMRMNGRAVVHLLLEIILIFKDKLFGAVVPALIISVFVCGGRALGVKNMGMYMCFSMCGMLMLPYTYLREGVFWLAGALNYIYPTAMFFAAFYIFVRTAERKKLSIPAVAVLFLAAATTEQGGAAAVGAGVLYMLTLLKERNAEKLKKCALMLVVMSVGYATVMLSPSTFGRTVSESTERFNLSSRLGHVYNFAVGENAAFWTFEAALSICALSDMRRNKRLSAAMLSAAVCAAACEFGNAYFAAGIILTVALTIQGLTGLFTYKRLRSAVLLAGLATVGMLVFSFTFGYRNILPCLMIFTAICAAELTELLTRDKWRTAALTAAFVLGAVSFTPVMCGYLKNRVVINKNLNAAGDGTRDFYYDTELDPRYSYNQFMIDGYYRDAYREIYRIAEDTKIFLKGEDFRDLFVNGVHCENPIYIKDGVRYYPLRNVIEAYGGELNYNEETKMTEIRLNDKKYEFDAVCNTFISDGSETDAAGYRLRDGKYGAMTESTVYFCAEAYEKVFGAELAASL